MHQRFSEVTRGTIVRLFAGGSGIESLATGYQTGTAVIERIIREAMKTPVNGARRAKRKPRVRTTLATESEVA